MYIKSLFALSLAAATVLADTSSDHASPTTSASTSHVSGVPIPVTPSNLPACTNTAAKHACPGIAIKCPSSCPDTCYISVTNACCPGGGTIVCSMSEASKSAAAGVASSGVGATMASASGSAMMTSMSAMPSAGANSTSAGASSGAASASASTGSSGSTSGTQHTYQVASILAVGAGLFAVVMANM